MKLWLDIYPSPLGDLQLVSDEQGVLRALDFEDYQERMTRLLGRHYRDYSLEQRSGPAPAELSTALDAYFAGNLQALDGIAVATGGTDFQRAVWAALRGIAAGTTLSYGALAQRVGRPAASRAVGLANGSNPISIIVPCHRVIGTSGKLTGYGGGLWRKHWLLEHEARHA